MASRAAPNRRPPPVAVQSRKMGPALCAGWAAKTGMYTADGGGGRSGRALVMSPPLQPPVAPTTLLLTEQVWSSPHSMGPLEKQKQDKQRQQGRAAHSAAKPGRRLCASQAPGAPSPQGPSLPLSGKRPSHCGCAPLAMAVAAAPSLFMWRAPGTRRAAPGAHCRHHLTGPRSVPPPHQPC